MNLLQLCEPTFLYICKVNRIYRSGGKLDLRRVQVDVADLRGEVQSKLIQEDNMLNQQFESIELAYIYFIDSMLVASGMIEWNDERIAVTEFNRRAGDNEFFDLLYDAESEVGEEADGKLAFYYCCIGLGFTGMRHLSFHLAFRISLCTLCHVRGSVISLRLEVRIVYNDCCRNSIKTR